MYIHGNVCSEITVHSSSDYELAGSSENVPLGSCESPIHVRFHAQRLIQNINYDDYLDCAGYINQSRPAADATSSAHLEFPHGISLTNPAAAGETCRYCTTK